MQTENFKSPCNQLKLVFSSSFCHVDFKFATRFRLKCTHNEIFTIESHFFENVTFVIFLILQAGNTKFMINSVAPCISGVFHLSRVESLPMLACCHFRVFVYWRIASFLTRITLPHSGRIGPNLDTFRRQRITRRTEHVRQRPISHWKEERMPYKIG